MINNNIQESYCSFEVSKLLKEKGFEVLSKSGYDLKGEIHSVLLENHNTSSFKISRPTHALAIEWIRVNFNIHIYSFPIYINKAIGLSELSGYCFYANRDYIDTEYKTPQEATEAAILYTLQNLIK